MKRPANQEIEALRCFAVLIVVVGHSSNLLPWHRGLAETTVGLWAGVDVFFCISGFVITKAFANRLRAAAAAGREAFARETAAFTVRRLFRLVPAAAVWLALSYWLSGHFNLYGGFGSPAQNLRDIAAIVLGVSNIWYTSCTAGLLTGCGPHAIYWTVSLEQQFYLVFPFLVRLRRGTMAAVCAAVVVAFQFLPHGIWYWYFRLDTIFLGTLIALLADTAVYRRLEPTALHAPAARAVACTAVLGGILYGPWLLSLLRLPYVTTTVTTLAGVAVFLASFDRGLLFGPDPVARWMAIVGSRSYSIYLIHNTAMALTREIALRLGEPGKVFGPDDDVGLVVLAIVLLATLSEVTYRFVEVPFRRYGAILAGRIAAPKPVAVLT